MKILCVIDSLGSGGAQRQLVELAKGFKERGHDVSFLVYHQLNFFKSELDSKDVPVITIIESNYLLRVIKCRKAIREFKPNAVLSFLEASNFIATMSGFPFRKWKLVVGERSSNPQIRKTAKKVFYRWMHLFANYVVANSYYNLKLVKSINPLLAEDKCHVIYNIVDKGKWDITLEKSDSSKKFRIVVAASHQYLKNARGLIKAAALLTSSERERLVIDWFGGGSNDDSYTESVKLVKTLGLNDVFNFHPPTNKIELEFLNSDAIGLFSFYEGLPNVVCEAMMMGKPVIASSVSDVPLLLDKNFVFDPVIIDDISSQISYVMNLTEQELLIEGDRNKKRALEFFNTSENVGKYLKLLEQ